MISKKIPEFNLNYYYDCLENGLKVLLIEKPNFHKVSGYFRTNYGSIDTLFKKVNSDEIVRTPEGIAHFLEHITFHVDDETDAAVLFEKLSAESNAYTSKTQTCYYFTTLQNVEECVNLLLDFVQTPYFSDKIIESERKIIEQEINMVTDDVDEELSSGLLNLLFKKSPIRKEIGGSTESIKEINKELLKECYDTFYHPSNMDLILIGGFDHEKMFKLIKENQNKKTFKKIESNFITYYDKEDEKITKFKDSKEKDIIMPKACIGIRLDVDQTDLKKAFKTLKLINFLNNYYFQYAGVYYQKLDQLNLINDTFNFGHIFYKIDPYIEYTIDIFEVDKFCETFSFLIEHLKDDKIDPDKFEKLRKKNYAGLIYGLNNFENLELLGEEYLRSKTDPIDYLESIKDITIEEVEDAKKYFKKENICYNIFYPKK